MSNEFPISLRLNDDTTVIYRCDNSLVDQTVIEEMIPLLTDFLNNNVTVLSVEHSIENSEDHFIELSTEEPEIKKFQSDKHIKNVLGNYTKCDGNEQEHCFICLQKYNKKEYKRTLKCCNHYFHKKCIDKWLKTNSCCPLCKCDQLENEKI